MAFFSRGIWNSTFHTFGRSPSCTLSPSSPFMPTCLSRFSTNILACSPALCDALTCGTPTARSNSSYTLYPSFLCWTTSAYYLRSRWFHTLGIRFQRLGNHRRSEVNSFWHRHTRGSSSKVSRHSPVDSTSVQLNCSDAGARGPSWRHAAIL